MAAAERIVRYARAATIMLVVAASPTLLRAQMADVRNREIAVGTGLEVLSDALGPQCGHNSAGAGVTLGAALLQQLGHHLIAQLDTRLVKQQGIGCVAIGVPIDTTYDRSLSRDLRITSTIRLGVETPASWPLFRLTAGFGADWGSPTLGMGALGLTWSTRGEHRRFFVQFDRLQTRIHAVERHYPFLADSASSRPIVTYPKAQSLSLGLSFR